MLLQTIQQDDYSDKDPYSDHKDWYLLTIEDKLERLKEKQDEIIASINKMKTKLSNMEI